MQHFSIFLLVFLVLEADLEECDLFCLKSKTTSAGYKNKVQWIKKRFKEGLKHKLLLVKERKRFTSRGVIEYMAGEYAWRGVDAYGYMVIHCMWVVGKYKNLGYGSLLLHECLHDAEGMNSVAVVATTETRLPKNKLFVKHGFEKVDEMPPLALYVKRFSDTAPIPKFNRGSQEKLNQYASGMVIFQSTQCPYSVGAVNVLKEVAVEVGLSVHIEPCGNLPGCSARWPPTWDILCTGKWKVLTYHSESKAKLVKLLTELTYSSSAKENGQENKKQKNKQILQRFWLPHSSTTKVIRITAAAASTTSTTTTRFNGFCWDYGLCLYDYPTPFLLKYLHFLTSWLVLIIS